MKTRNGFVSNSSSSNFLILTKKGELTEEILMPIFKTEQDSFFYDLSRAMIANIIYNADEITPQDYIKHYGYASEEIPEIVAKAMTGDYRLYAGSFESNGEGPVEEFLCEHDLNYEDENIIIEHEGGY